MKIALSTNICKCFKAISIIVPLLILVPFLTSAQTRGTVTVIKDPLIDTLIARRPSMNKLAGTDDATNGYRVQIFFGSSRQAAYDAQAKFAAEYQEYRTYITYSEPNFRVRAGDFKSRMEAEKLMKDLSATFTTLFIVPEKINPPKTDQE